MTSLRLLLLAFPISAGAADVQSMTFVMQEFPPFVQNDKGRPSGPFPDILRAVCGALQAECKQEVYPWRRANAMAQSGAVDGILMILKTPQREAAYHIGPPLMQSSYVLYAQQQTALNYRTPQDLAGYTVGAYGPSGTSFSAAQLVKRVPGARLEVEIDNPTALRKLRMGRYGSKAVVVINLELAQYLMQPEGDAGLKQVGELQKTDYHIGLSRKKMSQPQAEAFNAALLQLLRDGTVAAIAKKYGLTAAPAN